MKFFRSDILENLWMALGTLRANKLRSFLTVFGVIIGVITVMLIASIIAGVDTAVTSEVESFGTRSMYITKFDPGIHVGRRSREERMRKELTYDDAIALSKLPTIEVSVPFLDITSNFFGRKINVSGGGKTSASVAHRISCPFLRVKACSDSDSPLSSASSRSLTLWSLLPVKYCRSVPNRSGGRTRKSACKPLVSSTDDLVGPCPSTRATNG